MGMHHISLEDLKPYAIRMNRRQMLRRWTCTETYDTPRLAYYFARVEELKKLKYPHKATHTLTDESFTATIEYEVIERHD